MFTEVSGFPAPQVQGPFMEVMVDQVFAEVWNRPGLTRKERRWISLTCVAAAGIGDALAVHVGGALSSGDISIEELREFVTHFAAYAGYPEGVAAAHDRGTRLEPAAAKLRRVLTGQEAVAGSMSWPIRVSATHSSKSSGVQFDSATSSP